MQVLRNTNERFHDCRLVLIGGSRSAEDDALVTRLQVTSASHPPSRHVPPMGHAPSLPPSLAASLSLDMDLTRSRHPHACMQALARELDISGAVDFVVNAPFPTLKVSTHV